MRTFRSGAKPGLAVLTAQLVVVALAISGCSGSVTTGTPTSSAGTTGGSSAASAGANAGASATSTPPSTVAISPQQILAAADYVKAGIASEFILQRQHKSASAVADERAVFGCWALADVLKSVPGTTVRAKLVRAYVDRSKAHDVAQVVLDFASAAQTQRYGAVVAKRLATCSHPKLAVAGIGPVFSSSSAEPITTVCDHTAVFTAIATRHLPRGSNSLVLAMVLVANGTLFSLDLLLGPLSSNNPVQRSNIADAACAHLRG